GKLIQRTCADQLKRVTLELGGKSPNVVFADADMAVAVPGTCDGVFGNQGEVCSAGSRVFVERSAYDEVLDAMKQVAGAIRLGSGLDPATTMGPLVSIEQKRRVEEYLAIGRGEGAVVAFAGERPTDPALANGYFVAPTIFEATSNDWRISREEIFGPVMTVIPFDGVDEVVRLSNDTEYGLAAAIWTRDITKALRTAKAVRAGVVWINDSQPAPTESLWGGYKQSGVGRELGPYALEAYLEAKQIYINLGESNA
ncbi:MAG: aldehyde dehydrogenase family protein, partial [Ilumatobacteraceae bacterium]